MKYQIKMGLLAICVASMTSFAMAADTTAEPAQIAPVKTQIAPVKTEVETQSNTVQTQAVDPTNKIIKTTTTTQKENAVDNQSTVSQPAKTDKVMSKSVVKKTYQTSNSVGKSGASTHKMSHPATMTQTGMANTTHSRKNFVRGYW